MVAYRREASRRLAHAMPATDITVAQDATCTGGLCLVAMEPKSHDMLLEQAAHARNQDTWQVLMDQALSGLVVSPSAADNVPRPLPSGLRRLTQPVTSPPNRFSTSRLPCLACIGAHRASRHPAPQPVACFTSSAVEATAVPDSTAPL